MSATLALSQGFLVLETTVAVCKLAGAGGGWRWAFVTAGVVVGGGGKRGGEESRGGRWMGLAHMFFLIIYFF